MNIKKIIAREGLIALFLIIGGYMIGDKLIGYDFRNHQFKDIWFYMRDIYLYGLFGNDKQEFGLMVKYLSYPAYLLIRFIIWAIKTLKGRNR